MKETQTTSKLSTRSAENRTGRSKKISNKSLNDISESFSEESIDFLLFSEITEISEENLTEDATIFSLEEPASVTLLPPEEVIYTIENSSTDSSDLFESFKFTGMEDDAGLLYKMLKDEIIDYVLQDLNHNVQPEDRSHMQPQSQVVSRKKPFLFLCVIIWFIGVLAVLFFTPDVDCGLVPT